MKEKTLSDGIAKSKIAVLGTGNMGSLVAEGLLASNSFDVRVARRKKELLLGLVEKGACACENGAAAAMESDIVLVAVKPYDVAALALEVSSKTEGKLVVCVANGVEISSLERLFSTTRVIRAMPNLCAGVRKSITALCGSENATDADRKAAESIFFQIGDFVWVKEGQMAAFTAVAGCGPAIVANAISVFAQKLEENGFDRKDALFVASKTFEGTASLAEQMQDALGIPPKVATKGGSAEMELNILNDRGVWEALSDSLEGGKARAEELAKKKP